MQREPIRTLSVDLGGKNLAIQLICLIGTRTCAAGLQLDDSFRREDEIEEKVQAGELDFLHHWRLGQVT